MSSKLLHISNHPRDINISYGGEIGILPHKKGKLTLENKIVPFVIKLSC
jgi:hypothetical protein